MSLYLFVKIYVIIVFIFLSLYYHYTRSIKTMVSSARVSGESREARSFSSQEEDLLLRSTKKSQDHEIKVVKETPSYKDRLLTSIGGDRETGGFKDQVHDVSMADNVPKQQEEGAVKPRTKGTVVPLSDEELKLWLNPWKNTPVVNVLGKKINYRMIENKLRRTWTKNGGIQIIGMHDGYFQVVFKREEDYKYALFEGPWKLADHYLIVQ